MGNLGHALCEALNINPKSTKPENQATQTLFAITNHPVCPFMFSSILGMRQAARMRPPAAKRSCCINRSLT